MADNIIEKEYIIPLRREWLKVPQYERTGRAIKAIKKFIAKHMKIPDRDVKKVKLDVFFNNEIWFRGRKNPPSKIKLKAIKEKDIVRLDFVEIPEHVKFIKQKLEKRNKEADKKPEEKKEEIKKPEEKTLIEKTEEQKIDEKEKEQAVAEQRSKENELQAKAQKHLTKKKETSYHRMALKK